MFSINYEPEGIEWNVITKETLSFHAEQFNEIVML
jgi:hypothetical protein